MKDTISDYIKKQYGSTVQFKSMEEKNYCFDVFIHDKNINFSIEYKERFFKSGQSDRFLYEYDALIELVQSTPYIQKLNLDCINAAKAHDINVSIGWFYKCTAKRLIFFRYLDEKLFDVIDFDFELFKSWFMNNIHLFKLSYSSKSTGTINAVVKMAEIPKVYYCYTTYKGA